MHNAGLEKSNRLQRTLEILKAFPDGATTWEIQTLSNSMCPGTDISELRMNDYDIRCQYEGRTSTGRKVYRYTLHGKKGRKN